MCGILGSNVNRDNFFDALKIIEHRGPDNIEYKRVDNFLFGHVRLAIIDLETEANQPMEFDNIVIVFNGEIYNYKELIKEFDLNCTTTSDTEVLIRLYQKFGFEFLKYLNGMFSFAIFDKTEKLIFFARDRFGKKPFYYYHKNGNFIFSSEIKSILKLLDKKPNLNLNAFSEYLSFMTPLNDTFYEGISKLKAGYGGVFRDGKIELEKYYDVDNIEITIFDEKEAISKIKETLLKSVKYRLTSDVEVASLLSGGVDSSLISAMYTKFSNKKINTFSIGYDEYKHYDELSYAKIVSKHINSNHHEISISKRDFIETIDNTLINFDEPMSDSASIPTYILSKYIHNKYIKVALSGEGSDELFLGYDYYFNVLKYSKNYSSMANHLSQNYQNLLLKKNIDFKFPYDNKNFSSTNWLSYIDLKIWIAEVLMSKLDKMSMANSLELRTPFLDYNLVELSFKIDEKIKRGNTNKYLIKKIAEKYLPREIVHRDKKGFSSPFIEWLYDEYGNEILNLFNRVNKKTNLFNSEFLKFLYNEGKKRRLKQNVWSLYIFCRWYEREYL